MRMNKTGLKFTNQSFFFFWKNEHSMKNINIFFWDIAEIKMCVAS